VGGRHHLQFLLLRHGSFLFHIKSLWFTSPNSKVIVLIFQNKVLVCFADRWVVSDSDSSLIGQMYVWTIYSTDNTSKSGFIKYGPHHKTNWTRNFLSMISNSNWLSQMFYKGGLSNVDYIVSKVWQNDDLKKNRPPPSGSILSPSTHNTKKPRRVTILSSLESQYK
jgi:hypothetical protein